MAKGKHRASSAQHASHAVKSRDGAFAAAHGSHAAAASAAVARPAFSISIPKNLIVIFKLFAAVAATVAVAIVISLGFASAGNNGIVSQEATTLAAHPAAATTNVTTSEEAAVLLSGAQRDMSASVAEVQAQEEAIRIAEEERARVEEAATIEKVAQAKAASAAAGGVGVNDVDFSVGKAAFIEEWTARINKYLVGSPLAGQGATFAEAAWKYGVDPRWSPAISNTESTKGANCFAWHNAWGWTGGSWSSWGSAIDAHVRGLASVYGYTISYSNAQRYCPPNYHNWYNDTLGEMRKI